MKFVLKKDLPFAKAGEALELTMTNRNIVEQFDDNARPVKCYLAKETTLQRLISEGWIVEVKPREVWQNVYDNNSASNYYQSKEKADDSAYPHRIECVHYVEVIE